MHGRGSEALLQLAIETPCWPRTTTEKIEADRLMFGKRVYRKMRLGEETEPRDSTVAGELVPACLTDGMQIKFLHYGSEQRLQRRDIAQRVRSTTVCFYDPLDSVHPVLILTGMQRMLWSLGGGVNGFSAITKLQLAMV
jgi:hypothetical protein